MVKSELANKLNEKFPELKDSDVELALDCILGQMMDKLANGERIEIRGFGSFKLRRQDLRIAGNPKTGEKVNAPANVRTHFKPSKDLKDRVNSWRGKLSKPE
jgi:integration host factor subunit beta